MIKKSNKRGGIGLAGLGLATCMLMQPMSVSATELQSVKDVLQQAGIASYFEMDLTQEEYVAKAKEAEGASWGYTNMGIANVESGNLNVRAEASTIG